jgi:hypothetical protein
MGDDQLRWLLTVTVVMGVKNSSTNEESELFRSLIGLFFTIANFWTKRQNKNGDYAMYDFLR